MLVRRIRLRSLYARVLGNDKNVSLRTLKVAEKYVLDSHFLRILVALNTNNSAKAIDGMDTVKRLVNRSEVLRRDRSLQILVRLLATFANTELTLDNCRKRKAFCKYEAELSTYKTMASDVTVISPLSIWKAVVARA